MSKSNKTSEITFNLHERGRKYSGIDRSNVHVPSLVKLINSDKVQEMVRAGDLKGYNGHYVRQLSNSIIPPEQIYVNGKIVNIEPAFKTIYLKADDDGTVTHKVEFFDTDMGQYVKKLYKSGVGGFSTAIRFAQKGNMMQALEFGGFDFVNQRNFLDNIGDGLTFDSSLSFLEGALYGGDLVFDSANNPVVNYSVNERYLINQAIAMQYDTAHQFAQMSNEYDNALDLITQQQAEIDALQREQRRVMQNEQGKKRHVQAISTISFDSAVEQANLYLQRINDENQKQSNSQPKTFRLPTF